MQETEALCCLIALTHIQGMGPVTIRRLLRQFGSAQAIWNMNPLLLTPYLSKTQQSNWYTAHKASAQYLQEAKRYLERARNASISLLSEEDPRYPHLLRNLPEAPPLLSVHGTLLAEDFTRSIAIVGTRNASYYGLEMARHFARELASMGFTIISGLARGIDTQAHQGALETGRTVAILGSGLLRIYPSENALLAKRIANQGSVLSGFSLDAAPDRGNFPQRNRIVSLSCATLLIEAPISSGAMLTAASALEQGRPVFALPGKVDQESFQGSLQLLQQGRAKIALTPSDLAKLLGSTVPAKTAPTTNRSSVELQDTELNLLQCIGSQELSMDQLSMQFKLSAAQLNVLLMRLVLKKKIKELPGKRYTCLAS